MRQCCGTLFRHSEPHYLCRYGLAVAACLVSGLLRWAMPAVFVPAPYLAFLPAVVIAAILGGFGPGITASAISLLLVQFVFPFSESDHNSLLRSLIAVASCIAISLLAQRLRVATRQAERETERFKEAHKALQESEGRTQANEAILEAFFQTAPCYLAILDEDFRFLKTDPITPTFFGLDRNSVLGKSMADLAPDFTRLRPVLERVLETGEPAINQVGESPLPLAPGETLHWQASFFPVILGGGKRGIGVICVDVGELHRAKAELRERAAELETVLAAAPIPIYIAHGPECLEITGNAAADQLLRSSRGSEASLSAPIERRPRHFKVMQNGRILDEQELPAQRAARGVTVQDFESQLVFDDGSVVHLLNYATPLWDEKGRPMGSVTIAVDITDRKIAEESIRQLNSELELRVQERTKELEISNRELEAFSYTVAHDLRRPLRSISAHSSILLEDHAGELSEAGQDRLHRMKAAVGRMGNLIDDLLELSRISRVAIKREPVRLSLLAEELVAAFQEADPRSGMEVEISDGLTAHGDHGLLRQMLENLLGNAWKYSSLQENPRINFGSSTRENETVYFVQDNGIGFDQAHAAQMFMPFERLHGAGEFQGNGIGLATVQRIVSRHHGSIWAEGEEGKGATFFFTLSAMR
ncbi:MAG TPA: PAS domain-containing protein [Geomonas sp.]|nr:PAS domain-containing protein [Geomonas sp.]